MIKLTIRVAAVLAATLGTLFPAQKFESLHQFTGPDGRRPEQALTMGPDGDLYGTTLEGGVHNAGVIFRYSPEEGFSKVADLDPATIGSFPIARLLNIGDGYLYGACKSGTTAGFNTGGSVFKVDPAGVVSMVHAIPAVMGTPYRPVYLASGEPDVLHVLCEDNSGIRRVPLKEGTPTVATLTAGTPKPQSFIRAKNGRLYGATVVGGTSQQGTLFTTNADGTGYDPFYSAVYEDGCEPVGAMVEVDGFLYGLMSRGGFESNNGVLYRLSYTGEYSIVHRFTDFDYPFCDLLLASDGMLYGTGAFSGPGGNGNGGIWRIKPNGSGYKVLHVFQTGSGTLYPTGRVPVGGLVQGRDGNLYGTTQGGVGSGAAGTLFRLKLNLPPQPQNRAPIAVDDLAVTAGTQVAVNVLANDYDPDDDGLTVMLEVAPSHGTAEVQSDGTIVYTPGGSYAGADIFSYELSDGRGGKTVGTVTITNTAPPALFQPGGYNGLVSLDDDLDGTNLQPRGQFQLSVQPTGKFTGTLFTQKKRIALRGAFSNGTATATIVMPDKKSADVFFSFKAGNPSTIFAVFYGTQIWTGEAGPTRPSGETKNQSYTLQILANPAIINGPEGHGYGTVTVKPNGAVSVVGKLGDGSNLNWSTSLTELPGTARVIPVYSEPIKEGVISGLLVASSTPGEDFTGALRWQRPGAASNKPYPFGFVGDVNAIIGKFTPPAGDAPVLDVTSAAVRIFGAGVPSTTGTFTIDGKKITYAAKLKAFTINRSTGIFSGTMQHERKSISFKGAVNQGAISGYGYFTVDGETGLVDFVF